MRTTMSEGGERIVIFDEFEIEDCASKPTRLALRTADDIVDIDRAQVVELRDALDHWLRTGRLPGGEAE